MGSLNLQFAALAALFFCSSLAAGGDITAYRTTKVQTSLDASKAEGLWYEIAFEDIAQIGASCQTINNTYDASTGKVSQHFVTNYGPLPFAQTYTYEPDASGEKGVYVKYLNGAKALLKLPTVVVDVVDGEDGKYSLMTEFTSKTVLVVTVTELRFMARTPSVSAATLQTMKDVAASVGIKQSIVDSVKVVNHTACKSPAVVLV